MEQPANKEAVKQIWFPLGNLVAARVVTSFLPIDTIQKMDTAGSGKRHMLHHFHNVYPGDTIYAFETTDKAGDINAAKWVRGYSTSEPVPADYLAASTSAGLSRLPESHIHTVIVPRSCIQIKRVLQKIDINSKNELMAREDSEVTSKTDIGNTKSTDGTTLASSEMAETGSSISEMSASFQDDMSSLSSDSSNIAGGLKRPQLPLAAFSADTIEAEVCLEMKILSKIIFSVYTENDLEFFTKLVKIFNQLDEIRVNLSHNFLTRFERTITHKKAVMLFNRTAKLLSSSGGRINKRNVDASRGHTSHSRQFADYLSSKLASSTAIMARDENSAEMFQPEDLARVAQNQVLDALSPNYPLMIDKMSFLPERNTDFEAPVPSNLLIDFKEVSGSSNIVPRGYNGMSALMYLRTSKKRLTQAFSVTIGRGQAVFLDNLSAALFSNIPVSVLDQGKIYLVAILTENIRIDGEQAGVPKKTGPNAEMANRQTERQMGTPLVIDHLGEIRKGICAGVVDISRAFSRKKGHLAIGEAHRFVIKLFSSYISSASAAGNQMKRGMDGMQAMDGSQSGLPGGLSDSAENPAVFAAMNKKMAMSIAMQNSGWGQLVDRIITGSDQGIAVNLRAETLVLSIKELKDESPRFRSDSAAVSMSLRSSSALGNPLSSEGPLSFDQPLYTPLHRVSSDVSSIANGATASALASVGILDFNPYSPAPDMVYLRVSRFKDLSISFAAKTFLTVTCRASSNRLRFASGPNDTSQALWQFLTVAPGESLNEVVQVSGIGKTSTAQTDFLLFDVYANGFHIGNGKYLLRDNDRVYDTGLYQKHTQSVDIVGKGNTGIAVLEITLQYVGTTYNVDKTAQDILGWRQHGRESSGPAALLDLLKRFRRCDSATMSRFFSQLLYELVGMFDLAVGRNGTPELKTAVFESIVHILDITIARHNDQAVLFDQFLAECAGNLPHVGEILLSTLTAYFAAFNTSWNSTGRALCRTSVLALRLADACVHHRNEFVTQGYRFVDAITAFLASRKETFVADQLLVLNTLELYLDILSRSYQVSELASFAASWIGSTGLRGLASLPDENANALVNRRLGREHSILITKLLFMRRLLHGFIMHRGTVSSRQLLVVSCFKIAYRILMNPVVDFECSRLAFGVLLAVTYADGDGDGKSTSTPSKSPAAQDAAKSAESLSPGIVIMLFRSLPFLCRVFNRYYEKLAESGVLDRPKRTYTQLFPNSYPFTKYTLDSIVTDEIFSEVLIELSVVFSSFVQIVYRRPQLIRDYTDDPGIYETKMASFSPLDEFLGPLEISVTSADSLGETVEAIRKILSSRYFPGSRWISLQALVVSEVEHAIELFGDASVNNLAVGMGNLASANNDGKAGGSSVDPAKQTPALIARLFSSFLLSCTSHAVSLEHLAEIPRKGCIKLTGDMRSRGAAIFEHMWDNIGCAAGDQDKQRFHVRRFGGLQSTIIEQDSSDLAVDFLTFLFSLCMQHNAKCKQVGLDTVWMIVASEIASSENRIAKDTPEVQSDDLLFLLEQRSVTALYDLFERRPCGYIPRTADIRDFDNGLRELLQERLDREDVAHGSVERYVTTIGAYLDSFVGLGSIPDDPEFDDDRTFYKIRISGFLLDVDRPELFQSFVSQMYSANLEKGNHAQAALSLQLLADTYDWNNNVYIKASTHPRLPRQTMFKRKAELYVLIAKQFSRAKKHVQAIEVYENLLEAYEKYNFDLDGLSACHGELSRLYSEYQLVDRLDPTFFKVSFIGSGFPESFRSKQFIYEGLPYEHITSISGRLTRLYPGSHVVGNDEEAARLFALAEAPLGRFLHVKIVKPKPVSNTLKSSASSQSDSRMSIDTKTNESTTGESSSRSRASSLAPHKQLSLAAQQFAESKDLNTFVSSRRLPGSKTALTLWTEESTYTSCLTFPTLMNRSEIEKTEVVRLSPIENAIRSLSQKQDELESIEALIEQNIRDGVSLKSISSSAMFGNLSRILAGSVDSPVNGGMGQFRVFYESDKEHDMAKANRQPVARYKANALVLKQRLHDLIALLARLLKLHGMIVPAELHPQHQAMLELFASNFQREISDLHVDVFTSYDYHKLLQSLTASTGGSNSGSSSGPSRARRRAIVNNPAPGYSSASQFGGASVAIGGRHHSRSTRRSHRSSTSKAPTISSAAISLNGNSTMASTMGYDGPSFDPHDTRISSGSSIYGDESVDEGLLPRGKRTILNYR